jgi:hypothetical protein
MEVGRSAWLDPRELSLDSFLRPLVDLGRDLGCVEIYANLNGTSSVRFYEFNDTSITVIFKRGDIYIYSLGSVTLDQLGNMINHAINGYDLNAYINKHVYDLYDFKIGGY